MTTNNAVNTNLSGQSGTGEFVGHITPALVTPILGVASATSINFGGSALNTYAQSQAWTPVATFVTPGDLSVAYNTQTGLYSRIGNIVSVHFTLIFTPTFTTSTGNFHITGLPVPVNASVFGIGSCLFQSSNFPASTSSPFLQAWTGQSYIIVGSNGSGVVAAPMTVTEIVTGVQVSIEGSVTYLV
jgi:hypothetical protein